MRTGWRTAAVAVLAAVAACGDAAAQRSRTMHSVHDENGHRFEVIAMGEVEFSDDDRSVARLGPDARLSIEEARRGERDRRVEFRPAAGGGVRRLFYVDGDSRTPDAADRAWIERAVLKAIRDGGIGAERRVARIRAREGTAGVLREIERIDSDGGKKLYYRALLATPGLRGDEAATAIRHLARHVDSDGEKRHALMQVLERPSVGPAELAALLEASETIDSDGERASLLVRVAQQQSLRDGRVRAAFFRSASGISSDGELARVLLTVLRRDAAEDDALIISTLRTAREISSDGELARVLMGVPVDALRDRAVRAAYSQAMDAISSDGERSRALRHLARSAS